MKDHFTRIGGLLLILTAAVSLGMIGCSGGDDPLTPSSESTLNVSFERIDPAPATTLRVVTEFDDLILAVEGISARRSSGDESDGWYGYEFEPTEYSVDGLANDLCRLVNDAELPAGSYSQIRLLLCDGNYVVIDGVAHDLLVPGGLTAGLKIYLSFEIVEGQEWTADVTIDAAEAVRATGKDRYRLQSSLTAEAAVSTGGGIMGFVLPIEARVMVWIETESDTLATFAALDSGEFLLSGVPAGNHILNFTPTEEGPWAPCALLGVPVVDGEITDIGTFVLGAP